jgi:hypothetical protein
MERARAYCYRVEPKTMFPGFPKVIRGRNGQEIVENDPHVFTVIEGKTEQYITPGGYRRPKIGNMYMDEFFAQLKVAVNVAKKMHKRAKCNSSRCRWTQMESKKESAGTKNRDALRRLLGNP